VTFSIAAWDGDADPSPEWGIAVASKFLGVGAVVSWARAGAGAVATQALANLAYGPNGLELLEAGGDADSVVMELTTADSEREHRQLGVVDGAGRAATFTGSECFDWAGGRTGDGYCCQGNILTGPDVVDAMAESFEATQGKLGERLLAALTAGDLAGGDRRGRQSASLLVVRAGGGYGGGIDKAIDVRVDDHAAPVVELTRLFELHRLYFPSPDDLEYVDVDDKLADELRKRLTARGYEPRGSESGYDEALRASLYAYMGTENLEERWTDEPRIERRVLEYLRAHNS
jgi:uncharacterized Ntn-hydrolase superfamily protein